MKTSNLEAVELVSKLLNTAIQLMAQSQKISKAVFQAQQEGRDITKEELDLIVSEDDLAVKNANEALANLSKEN